MRARFWLIALMWGVSACASTVWDKPGVTPEALDRDTAECEREANRKADALWMPGHMAGPSRVGGVPSLRQSEHRRLFARCMRAKGYSEVRKDG
jgi:hypothetical protein